MLAAPLLYWWGLAYKGGALILLVLALLSRVAGLVLFVNSIFCLVRHCKQGQFATSIFFIFVSVIGVLAITLRVARMEDVICACNRDYPMLRCAEFSPRQYLAAENHLGRFSDGWDRWTGPTPALLWVPSLRSAADQRGRWASKPGMRDN